MAGVVVESDMVMNPPRPVEVALPTSKTIFCEKLLNEPDPNKLDEVADVKVKVLTPYRME